MSRSRVKFSPAPLPEGFCFTTYQAMFSAFASSLVGYVNVDNGIIAQSATPAAQDQGKIWVKLDSNGAILGLYYYYNGSWVFPHPSPPSGSERRLWAGLAADLVTYDGGDADEPMWEEDTDFRNKILAGDGTTVVSGTTKVDQDDAAGELNVKEIMLIKRTSRIYYVGA